jgi:hypothetical protein
MRLRLLSSWLIVLFTGELHEYPLNQLTNIIVVDCSGNHSELRTHTT